MNCQKIVLFVSNVLGINFAQQRVSTSWIIIFQLFFTAYGSYFILYSRIKLNYTTDIYYVMDILELELFFALQFIFVIRAFIKKSLQKNILESIEKKTNTAGERKFLVFILLLTRIVKNAIVSDDYARIFMLKTVFIELIFASSDFMFQLFISQLTINLKAIKHNLLISEEKSAIQHARREVLRIF